MSLVLINPLLGFIIIPQFIYINSLVKNKRQFELVEGFVKTDKRQTNKYGSIAFYFLLDTRDIVSPEDKLKVEQQKKNLNEKFHIKRILGITLILTISLFIIFVFVGKIIHTNYGIDFSEIP